MAEPTAEEQAAAEAKAKADADAAAAKAKAEADAKAAEVKFSQADLDRIAGNSRSEGRTQAEKELLAKLGVTDVEAAEAIIKAAKDAEDANKTELQKAQEAREAAEKLGVEALAKAHDLVASARLEGALRDAGINAERLPAALKLADLSALKVEGTEVSGVAEVVESVKESSPEWFGTVKRTAPDANAGGGAGGVDYRTASREDRRKAAAEYGVRI